MTKDMTSASPLDRFASGVIDYLILGMPFVYLILAPFERISRESALYSEHGALTIVSVLGVVAALFFLVLYQALMTWAWGGTVGQLILGLRVRSIWGEEKIRLSTAALRAVLWLLTWAFLGVPLLALFSNRLRRAIHDRITDTYVISLRQGRAVRAPSLQESALVRGVLWAFGMVALLFGLAVLWSLLGSSHRERAWVAALESEGTLCEAVSEAQSNWPSVMGPTPDRLNVAMALYAANVIDRKCLQAEVEVLHLTKEASAALYLVKSFVYADRSDISDQYLENVCAEFSESPECKMSTVIRAVSEDNLDVMQSALSELKKTGLVYPAIWAVRQYLKHEDYRSAEEFLTEIPNQREFSEFINPARAKILWALDRRDEAAGVEAAAYATMGVDAKVDLSSFMCFERIWNSCEAVKERSCETFSNLVSNYDDMLSANAASLAYLRIFECKEGPHPNYEKILNEPINENAKALAGALSSPGTDGFTDLLEDSDGAGPFAAEVSRRLVERTKSVSLLKEIKNDWLMRPATSSWQKVGATLFRKFYDLKEYRLGSEVAMQLNSQLEPNSNNKNLFEQFIVTLFKMGDVEKARGLFLRYEQFYPLPMASPRSPASEDNFLSVANVLRGLPR